MRGFRPACLVPAVLLGAACGSAGGLNSAGHPPDAPQGIAASAGPDSVTVSWSAVAGARRYTVYWAASAGVTPSTGTPVAVASSPFVDGPLPAGRPRFYVVTASNEAGEGPASAEVSATPGTGESIAPNWANVAPTRVLVHAYDPARSAAENGAALQAALARLLPGDRLEIAAGRYVVGARFGIHVAGRADAPVWIAPRPGAAVVWTRPDAAQNAANLDFARYLALQGIEITGGDTALKLYDCSQVWIDRCHIHHCAGAALAANSAHTDHLYITGNEIHDTAGSGEGMYLGANYGQFVTHHCVIAFNHVYRCGGSQGDGIELKQGSYANRIVGNEVHDTNYPCILVYGTAGREPNVVERNVCYRSNDNVLQVQGEAIVRNNALFGGSNGFSSHDHQGQTRDLVFVHNTILTAGRGASLSAWSGRPGMVFANNVVYSSSGDAIRFGNGSSGVTISSNVVLGAISGTAAAFLRGTGLADFAGASYDGTARDVWPSVGSPLLGAADPAFAVSVDLVGAARQAPFDAGCRER